MASPGCDLPPWFLCSWSRQSWVPWGLEVFASVHPLFSFWHCPSILPAAVPVFLPCVWCHCPVCGGLSWLLCPLQRVCVSIGSVPPMVGPAPPLTMGWWLDSVPRAVDGCQVGAVVSQVLLSLEGKSLFGRGSCRVCVCDLFVRCLFRSYPNTKLSVGFKNSAVSA